MDIAYLHVVINHLPIMGVPLALALLLLGAWTRDAPTQQAALLGFIALGVATVLVFVTGQGGEDFIEQVPGVAERAIDPHEDMATVALSAVGVLAALALFFFIRHGGAAMLLRRDAARAARLPAAGLVLVAVAAVIASGLLGYTGRLGGRISHTEFSECGAPTEMDDDRRRDERGRRRRGRD